jgi:hypothetical protein
MKTEYGQFFEEGIRRYEEARDTIIVFEQGLAEIVEQTAKKRKDWRPLKDHKIGHASANRSDQYGYWIAIEITGKTPQGKRAVIDCGLWWKAEKWAGVTYPIIYANYNKQPEWVADFIWKKKNSKIQSFSAWGRTFLYLPLEKVADIEGSLNTSLSALLKQLK